MDSRQQDHLAQIIVAHRRERYAVAKARLREATSYLLPWRCDDYGPWQPRTMNSEGTAMMRRLHALRPVVPLAPSWDEDFGAIEAEIAAIAARPKQAIARRQAKAAKRAAMIRRLSATYDELRPARKRPAWIAMQMADIGEPLSAATIERVLADMRRAAKARV